MLSSSTIAQTRPPGSLNILSKSCDQNQLSFTYRPAYLEAGKVIQFTDSFKDQPTSYFVQNPNLTFTAASPSFADVSAAVSRAKAGDTVIVPAGQAIWATQLVITKGVKLIGAGIGSTVIIGNYAAVEDRLTSSAYLVVYRPSNPKLNEPFRLSGFTFDPSGKAHGLLLMNTSPNIINQIRIDHLRIENCLGSRPMSIYGTIFGVADNNQFVGCYMSVDGLDDKTWNNVPFNFGTANSFYFEDNQMIGVNYLILRSEMGAIWCARHNTWDATNVSTGLYPLFDMHGNIPNAHNSAMGVEIYGNTVIEPGHGVKFMDQRGGMALIYENYVTSTGWAGIQVREEYLDFLNAPATSRLTGQPQHVSGSYYWGNKQNGNSAITPYANQTVDYGGAIGLVPMENREFWSENTSFNGTTGVGVGLLANRPKTCTNGVAYWATDAKTLYRSTAKNTWNIYYTPYPYPHPLRDR